MTAELGRCALSGRPNLSRMMSSVMALGGATLARPTYRKVAEDRIGTTGGGLTTESFSGSDP